MQNQRLNVIGRLGRLPGRLAVGLLVMTVTACVGCSQPRSFLDTTVMQQQMRDAQQFWGPDGRVGQAPLAHRVPEAASAQPVALLARNDADSGLSLFPATYRAVTLPRSQSVAENRANIAVAASPPSPSRMMPDPVMTVSYEPPVAAPAPANALMPRAEKTIYVASRPRDDGLMMTALEESESLPPLPPESSGPAPSPRTEASADAPSNDLPPLPPGSE